MENASKVERWYGLLGRSRSSFLPVLLTGLGLVVVLGGLSGFNPFIGVAGALILLLLVLVVPRPVLIAYALALLLPLTGGFARGAVVPFLRLSQALLVVGAILFVLAKPSPQGKSRLTAIDLAFVLFFLTEAVFPMLALYYRGEHLNLTDPGYYNQGTPLQNLLGPLQYYLLYRIVVATISSEKQIITVLKLSFVASIVVSVIGILQQVGVAPIKTFIDTYYPHTLLGDPMSGDRISSTLGSYSGLAAYLSFIMILALACYTSRKGLKISSLLLAITLLVDSIALLLTGTFTAAFGVVVGAAVIFLLIRRVPKLVIFALIGIGLALLIFQPVISGRLAEWLGGSSQGVLPTFADRIRLWKELFLPSISQHLLFGNGPAPAALNYWPTEETQYLYLLDRGGLAYFFSYLLLMGVAIAICWQQVKKGSEGLSRTVAIATLSILVAINVMNISSAYFTEAGGTQTLWMLLAIVVASGQFKALRSLTTARPVVDDKRRLVGKPLQGPKSIATAPLVNRPRLTAASHVTGVEDPLRSYRLVPNSVGLAGARRGRKYYRFPSLTRFLDWHFVKDSVVVSAGSTIARMLGLLFWIVLAHLLTPDDVGFVRYVTILAPIIVIAATASPVSITRSLAANRHDREARDRYFSNGMLGVVILLIVSLLASVPLLLLLHAFNLGTILCVVGLAAFFIYFSVARGMGSAWKMGLAYSLSNIVQIVAIVVVLGFFGLRTATAALMIYGLTYLSPIILELLKPMALRFRPSLISKKILLEMARFAVPLVLSSGAYTIWFGMDVLLIENYAPHAAGGYAAAKTLAVAFTFIPAAITIVLMPRVAALGPEKSKRYTAAAVLATFLLCLVGLVIVAVWGHKLIAMTFGQRYGGAYLPLLVMGAGMSFYSVYLVLEGFVIGRGRPNLPVQAMVMALLSTGVIGFWLTPWLGTLGASLSFSIGAALGTTVMLLRTWLFLNKGKQLAGNSLSS